MQMPLLDTGPSNLVTNDSGDLPEEDTETHSSWNLAESLLLIFYPPVLLLLGIPGNVLTLWTLNRRSIREHFMSIALASSAVINLWCLLTTVTRYWSMGISEDGDWSKESYYLCLIFWTARSIGFSSAHWIIVLITCCRLYFLTFPQRMCTEYSPFRILAFIIILLLTNIAVQTKLTLQETNPFFQDIVTQRVSRLESCSDNMTFIVPSSNSNSNSPPSASVTIMYCTWKTSGNGHAIKYMLESGAPILSLLIINFLMCTRPDPYILIVDYDSLEAVRLSSLNLALVAVIHFLFFAIPPCIFPLIRGALYPDVQMDLAHWRVAGLAAYLYFYTGSATQFYAFCYCNGRFRYASRKIIFRWIGLKMPHLALPSRLSVTESFLAKDTECSCMKELDPRRIDTNVDKGNRSVRQEFEESFESMSTKASTWNRQPSFSL